MITEDRVSFEIAKLLRDKGFEQDTVSYPYYTDNGNLFTGDVNTPRQRYYNAASAPTLQMTMKWLREVHNLCLEPYRTACGYLCNIARVPSGSEIYQQEYDGDDEVSGQFITYEKSCEAAIKYALENLI